MNNKFTLTLLTDWPDDPNYKPEDETAKREEKIKFSGRNFAGDYVFSNMIKSTSMLAQDLKIFVVSKNHPVIQKLVSAGKLQTGTEKLFTIRFGVVDEIDEETGTNYDFNELNQELEILET